MQALILHDDPRVSSKIATALSRRGFLVASTRDQSVARAFVRTRVADLVLLKQVVAGRHTTAVALAAEHRNPRVATLVLSDAPRTSLVELFALVPSLQGILPLDAEPQFIATCGSQAIRNAGPGPLVLSPTMRLPDARALEVA